MWLLGRLVPDRKTIAEFRKDNGKALHKACAQFVELYRQIGLPTVASVAIDGSKFKAINNRDRDFTRAKMHRHKLLEPEGAVPAWSVAMHKPLWIPSTILLSPMR